MKYLLTVSICMALLFNACTSNEKKCCDGNPFFHEYSTPFGVAPFNEIKIEHYLPAFEKGMAQQSANIEAIVNNAEAPTFENTIEAIEYSGPLLTKVSSVFYNMTGANTNDDIKAIAKELAPKLSKHSDDINLNPALFTRVKAVYEQKDGLNLNQEQGMLLEKTYQDFVRGGANLEGEAKEKFRKINQELSLLTLKFGDNVLAETNSFVMVVDNEADLAGLPKGSIDAAAATAEEKGMAGKWVFTIHKPSMIPFLQYAENRELREKIFKAYINKGDNNNEFDNKETIKKIASLRVERANLLGFESHAAFILDKNMAKTPEVVNEKLAFLMERSTKVAKQELKDMQAIVKAEGGKFKIEAWDWWFYSEKVKQKKFNLDENDIKPYFELENVVKGALYTAEQLYGLQFEARADIPTPHAEARAYEVKEANGDHIGVLFMDFHPRESKRGGAWMNSYRKQEIVNGEFIHPVITMVCNFTKPTANTPALLSFEEVTTLFHEFGHALHGLLSKCTYYSLSGTAVPRDFVELPSQVMEHWASEPEVLNGYAKHYKTGEIIPTDLVNKIQKSGTFNQGFITTEYLAAAILDMDYHTLTAPLTQDINAFEAASNKKMGLIPEIVTRYRSTYFNHVFSGGYSAGYYAYIWAAILDSDAFDAFEENGIFDKETAAKFRTNVLEKGGTVDPMVLYKNFRGQEPNEKALLEDRGLL